jgi:hypothetical protein
MVDCRDSLAFAVTGTAAIARYLGVSEAEAERLCEAAAFPRFQAAGQWAATRRALDRYRERLPR